MCTEFILVNNFMLWGLQSNKEAGKRGSQQALTLVLKVYKWRFERKWPGQVHAVYI